MRVRAAPTVAGAAEPLPHARVAQVRSATFIEDCRRRGSAARRAGADQRTAGARARRLRRDHRRRRCAQTKGGLQDLYRSPELTILNIVWAAVHAAAAARPQHVGTDRHLFRARGRQFLEARPGATDRDDASPSRRERCVAAARCHPLGRQPESRKLTGAIRIYGGDSFAVHRSEWDPETLTERNWDIREAVRDFEESNARFFGRRTAAPAALGAAGRRVLVRALWLKPRRFACRRSCVHGCVRLRRRPTGRCTASFSKPFEKHAAYEEQMRSLVKEALTRTRRSIAPARCIAPRMCTRGRSAWRRKLPARARSHGASSLSPARSIDDATSICSREFCRRARDRRRDRLRRGNLAAHPLVGRRVEGDVRELVISYGPPGTSRCTAFVVQQDEVRVLALRHQREIGYLP